MFHLVYISAETEPFSQESLHLLLLRSRKENASRQVTGMLLYHCGSFMQVLEGLEQAVEHIFFHIQRDPRHHQIEVRLREPIKERDFCDWTMGFIDSSQWNLPPGMVDYQQVPQLAALPAAAHRCLRLFHQGLCRQIATEPAPAIADRTLA
jgi:hypothetical protein